MPTGLRWRSSPGCSMIPGRRAPTSGSRTRRSSLFGDHPRFTDPAAAEALVAANGDLERITIEHAGDLPQLERPDETAAVIDRFLA